MGQYEYYSLSSLLGSAAMMISNAISFFDLLDLIGTLATVTALIYTVRAFQKSVRIQEANFLQNLFDGFHRDRQTILDNPTALAILAKEREVAPEEIIR